jgi:imidazolonepropionase-like amidohydrolase
MADQDMFVIPTLSLFASLDGAGLGPQLAVDARIAAFINEGQRKVLTAPPAQKDKLGAYGERFNVRNALETVRRLRAAGVRILAGDDAPNLAVHGVSIHGEMQLLTRAGMKPAEALEAATRGPAEVFKLADRGRIVTGARADLVLVDGNPLSDIKATRAIVHVFKNGFAIQRDPAPPTKVP